MNTVLVINRLFALVHTSNRESSASAMKNVEGLHCPEKAILCLFPHTEERPCTPYVKHIVRPNIVFYIVVDVLIRSVDPYEISAANYIDTGTLYQ